MTDEEVDNTIWEIKKMARSVGCEFIPDPERVAAFKQAQKEARGRWEHPQAGDVVGDRTIIRVLSDRIIYGQKDGDIPNCGAYVTNYREWFEYERNAQNSR